MTCSYSTIWSFQHHISVGTLKFRTVGLNIEQALASSQALQQGWLQYHRDKAERSWALWRAADAPSDRSNLIHCSPVSTSQYDDRVKYDRPLTIPRKSALTRRGDHLSVRIRRLRGSPVSLHFLLYRSLSHSRRARVSRTRRCFTLRQI